MESNTMIVESLTRWDTQTRLQDNDMQRVRLFMSEVFP